MKKSSFKKYETRNLINRGARLGLADPITGEATEDWLGLRYSLADDYEVAREEATRALALDIDDLGSVERSARLLVPLVVSWSFEEDCTPANIFEFLCSSPHLHNAIIKKATTEGKFFSTPLMPSVSGPGLSLASTGNLKGQPTG